MKIKHGIPFSLKNENKPIDDMTISLDLKTKDDTFVFSLGQNTDISKESYDHPTFVYVISGHGFFNETEVKENDFIFYDEGCYLSKKTTEGLVYVEFHIKKENSIMNEKIKAGEIFKLKDLLPYMEDKIVNIEVFKTDKSRLSVISMAKGTQLTPHKAPGEALLFILDGKATLNYEGKEYILTEGDNFSFAKDGIHAITADTDFKFALFLEI